MAVFLGANRISERLETLSNPFFTVGELGFGTGLNFVLTVREWIRSGAKAKGQRLIYISTEIAPLPFLDLSKAWEAVAKEDAGLLSIFQGLAPVTWPRESGFHWRGFPELGVELRLFVGDARDSLPLLERSSGAAGVNAWYLDGFAPSKNPELWEKDLFAEVARLSSAGATFGTYSASSLARASLASAGFNVERVTGYGEKKHRLQGRLESRRVTEKVFEGGMRPGKVHVIGGGMAGAASAFAFARRGISVVLWERELALASKASGNPASLLKAPEGESSDFRHRFYTAGFGATRALYERLSGDSAESGWVRMGAWIDTLLKSVAPFVEVRLGSEPSSLSELLSEENSHVVLATGTAGKTYPEMEGSPTWGVRGQLAYFDTAEETGSVLRAGRTYFIPAEGMAGATFTVRDFEERVRPEENERLWRTLADGVEGFAEDTPFEKQDFSRGRVAFRPVSPDAFPSVGALPDLRGLIARGKNDLSVPRMNRVWTLMGLGSKGLTGSLLASEHLASLVLGEFPVVDSEIARRLDPARHSLRELARPPEKRSQWWKEVRA